MVSLGALWLPIVLSAVLVFVVSSVIHMVLKWHNSDYHGFSNEEAVRAAVRSGNPAPGTYVIPYCADMKEMQGAAMQQKFVEGPVGVVYLKRAGPASMGASLGQWFVFTLVVSFFVAYIASHALPQGSTYLKVFQVVGSTGFLAYAAGNIPSAIWMGKPWPATTKETIDALLYGMVTAGAFGWLWPR
jgi:hypothetical protein